VAQAKAEWSYDYLRLATLAGSRFNALRTDEQEVQIKKGWAVVKLSSLPFISHLPRRSGRSSALPYPPGKLCQYNKKRNSDK